uniref:Uncharacterized protein n=1 Tax=Ananas comosus var. bracteatus TaxID=296719 RepID=A0A6V7PG90_ANACO|nr:unnamed protein product [Ananas comosus var. bracteatus]
MGLPKLTHAETKLGRLIRRFYTNAPSLLYMLLAEKALASLWYLCIHKFNKESFRTEEEQVFQHLTSLESLVFESCSLMTLPNNLKGLSSLGMLRIINCPNHVIAVSAEITFLAQLSTLHSRVEEAMLRASWPSFMKNSAHPYSIT